MAPTKKTPGPIAQSAFRTGMYAAAIAWIGGTAVLYSVDVLTPIVVGYAMLMIFPVYLVFAAATLNVWLGYGKDATDLQPVYRNERS